MLTTADQESIGRRCREFDPKQDGSAPGSRAAIIAAGRDDVHRWAGHSGWAGRAYGSPERRPDIGRVDGLRRAKVVAGEHRDSRLSTSVGPAPHQHRNGICFVAAVLGIPGGTEINSGATLGGPEPSAR
jgi:hypothetical protein